jgi:hypothetical protein
MISPFDYFTVIGQKREEKKKIWTVIRRKKAKKNPVNKKRAKRVIGLLPAQPV